MHLHKLQMGCVLPWNHVEYYMIAMITPRYPALLLQTILYNSQQVPVGFWLLVSIILMCSWDLSCAVNIMETNNVWQWCIAYLQYNCGTYLTQNLKICENLSRLSKWYLAYLNWACKCGHIVYDINIGNTLCTANYDLKMSRIDWYFISYTTIPL